MLESQLSGRTAVRSLAPSSVEMTPFWSTLRIMVASTKYIRPFLSTAMPVGEEEEGRHAGEGRPVRTQKENAFAAS